MEEENKNVEEKNNKVSLGMFFIVFLIIIAMVVVVVFAIWDSVNKLHKIDESGAANPNFNLFEYFKDRIENKEYTVDTITTDQ